MWSNKTYPFAGETSGTFLFALRNFAGWVGLVWFHFANIFATAAFVLFQHRDFAFPLTYRPQRIRRAFLFPKISEKMFLSVDFCSFHSLVFHSFAP